MRSNGITYTLTGNTAVEQLKNLSGFLGQTINSLAGGMPPSTGTNSIVENKDSFYSSVSGNSVEREGEEKSTEQENEQEAEETKTTEVTEETEATEGTVEEKESTDITGETEEQSEDKGKESIEEKESTELKKVEETTRNEEMQSSETIINSGYKKKYGSYTFASLDYRDKKTNSQRDVKVIQIVNTGTNQSVALAGLIKAKEGVDQLLGSYQTRQELGSASTQSQLKQLSEGASALKDGVASLADGAGSLANGIGQLADGTNQLQSGVSELNDGGWELADGTKDLQSGVSDLADGVKELTDASDDLKDGSGQLADGTGDLLDGTQDLVDGVGELKDGTDEFKDKSSDIDTQIDEEVDKVINNFSGSDFTPLSFVSDKNTNVNLVQFVMKTDGIKMPEAVMPENAEEPLTFWQRLLNLFR